MPEINEEYFGELIESKPHMLRIEDKYDWAVYLNLDQVSDIGTKDGDGKYIVRMSSGTELRVSVEDLTRLLENFQVI